MMVMMTLDAYRNTVIYYFFILQLLRILVLLQKGDLNIEKKHT